MPAKPRNPPADAFPRPMGVRPTLNQLVAHGEALMAVVKAARLWCKTGYGWDEDALRAAVRALDRLERGDDD